MRRGVWDFFMAHSDRIQGQVGIVLTDRTKRLVGISNVLFCVCTRPLSSRGCNIRPFIQREELILSETVSTTQRPRVSSSVSASSPHTRTGEWTMAKISSKYLCEASCLLQKKRIPRSTPLFSQLSRRMPTDTRPRRPVCAQGRNQIETEGYNVGGYIGLSIYLWRTRLASFRRSGW